MRIYIVSTLTTAKLAEFEKNCTGTEVVVVNQPVFPELNEHTAGVVVLDDGESNLFDCVSKVRAYTRYLSIPIIVLTPHAVKDGNSKLMAVGASLVCDMNCSPQYVMDEIKARSNTEPVLEEIRTRLLQPFTLATKVTFQEMAGVEVNVLSIYKKKDHKMFGDISAVIGLSARTEGAMTLSFPEGCASAYTQRILAGIGVEPTEDVVRDCIGEMANIIAGQAKGILAESPYRFTMTTPAIVSGAMHTIWYRPGMPCLVVAFGSEIGDFALQICLAL